MRLAVAVITGLIGGLYGVIDSFFIVIDSDYLFMWMPLYGLITIGVLIWLIAPKRNWRWPLAAFVIAFLLAILTWFLAALKGLGIEGARILSITGLIILLVMGVLSLKKWRRTQ